MFSPRKPAGGFQFQDDVDSRRVQDQVSVVSRSRAFLLQIFNRIAHRRLAKLNRGNDDAIELVLDVFRAAGTLVALRYPFSHFTAHIFARGRFPAHWHLLPVEMGAGFVVRLVGVFGRRRSLVLAFAGRGIAGIEAQDLVVALVGKIKPAGIIKIIRLREQPAFTSCGPNAAEAAGAKRTFF